MTAAHSCSLRGVSDSCLEPLPTAAGIFTQLKRKIQRSFLITNQHPNFQNYFRSHAALLHERKRHIRLQNAAPIHPLSPFRMYWEIWMCMVLIVSLIVHPVQVTFDQCYERPEDYTQNTQTHVMAYCLLFLDVNCILDIVCEFCSGYLDASKREVVLERSKVFRHYLTGYLVFDVLGALPTYFAMHNLCSPNFFIGLTFISLFKMWRLKMLLLYLPSCLAIINLSESAFIMLKQCVISLDVVHWTACLFYIVPVVARLHRGYWETHSWIVQADINHYSVPVYMKYVTCLFRATCHLLTAHYGIVIALTPEDILMSCAAFVFGKFFFGYVFVTILQAMMSVFVNESKYQDIINQLQEYMGLMKLPMTMQNRLVSYYKYRYRNAYFREEVINSTLSDRLKKEINVYRCRRLVEGVAVFNDLPPHVLSGIVPYLKAEVFLPNDIIAKAGSSGDCMYFLAHGTVAVYTTTGKEVCHLQDGAYFGEIALLIKDRKRIATVIAIEICEVYRLERKYFMRSFTTNPILYKNVEEIANERMEQTLITENLHKKILTMRSSDKMP